MTNRGQAVWPPGFDPASLSRHASLNKLVVGHAPGARPAHAGQNGGDLLGRDAVLRLVKQRCGVDVRSDAVTDWLNAAIAGDLSDGATEVVDEVGDRLASLVATLRDPASARAATGARRTYLDAWRSLDLVMFGGGLMKGAVGERVAARAAAVLAVDGLDPPVMRVAPHPEWLALLGAARTASGDGARVLVLDCGQTCIKRAVARFKGGQLASLRVFDPLSVDSVSESEVPAAVRRALSGLMSHQTAAATEVIISIASYVHAGRPVCDNASMYERLDPDSMASSLGVPVRLLHDGSAAWRAVASDVRSAVVMLGTWLGVGIGPHEVRLRPYSPDFTIHAEGAKGTST
jgi:hypothetical protein